VVLLLFIACNAQDKTTSVREEFQQQFESRIATLEQQIQDARNRANGLSGDDRTKADQSIAELDEKRSTLTSKLEAMKTAGDGEWEVLRTDLQETARDLDQAYGDLQGAFKDSAAPAN